MFLKSMKLFKNTHILNINKKLEFQISDFCGLLFFIFLISFVLTIFKSTPTEMVAILYFKVKSFNTSSQKLLCCVSYIIFCKIPNRNHKNSKLLLSLLHTIIYPSLLCIQLIKFYQFHISLPGTIISKKRKKKQKTIVFRSSHSTISRTLINSFLISSKFFFVNVTPHNSVHTLIQFIWFEIVPNWTVKRCNSNK